MDTGSLAVLLIFGPIAVVACGVAYAIVKKVQGTTGDRKVMEALDRLDLRVSEMERRINDLQDITLTLDDKLKRQ
jgi:hypothetical protein